MKKIIFVLLMFIGLNVSAATQPKEMPKPTAAGTTTPGAPLTDYALIGVLGLGALGLVIYQYNWKKEN